MLLVYLTIETLYINQIFACVLSSFKASSNGFYGRFDETRYSYS